MATNNLPEKLPISRPPCCFVEPDDVEDCVREDADCEKCLYEYQRDADQILYTAMREAKEAAELQLKNHISYTVDKENAAYKSEKEWEEWSETQLQENCTLKMQIESLESKLADMTNQRDMWHIRYTAAFEALNAANKAAEQAEATSYLPMIPEGGNCNGCQMRFTKICPLPEWHQSAINLAEIVGTPAQKPSNCPKPYIEPKGDK